MQPNNNTTDGSVNALTGLPETERQQILRRLCYDLLEEIAKGNLLSIFVIGETTGEDGFLSLFSEVENPAAVSGMMHHMAAELITGDLYGDEEGDED